MSNFTQQRHNLRTIKVSFRCRLLRTQPVSARERSSSERDLQRGIRKIKKKQKNYIRRVLEQLLRRHVRGKRPQDAHDDLETALTPAPERCIGALSRRGCTCGAGWPCQDWPDRTGVHRPRRSARLQSSHYAGTAGCRLCRDRRPTLSVDCRCRLPRCNNVRARVPMLCCCRCCARRVAARASANRRIYYIKPNAISGMTGQWQDRAAAAATTPSRFAPSRPRATHDASRVRSLILRTRQRRSHFSRALHLYRSLETTVLFSARGARKRRAIRWRALLFFCRPARFTDEYYVDASMI